ncbi:MAG: RecX family transcriptional regulator [Chloroflexaceae bacterium]|jgi:regulatory protein|nr:RecX family transcriptional regulator [Chloroflexaceae bacterium]
MPAGKITALRAQEHDSQRVNVFIDGAFAIGISLNTLSREGLHVGKVLEAEAWTRLESAEGNDKAFQAALRFLNARPRSTTEVRERLAQKSFQPEAIDLAVARLVELGLLNDEQFARFWVENRLTCRPRGARMLREELRRKGVSRTVVDTVLHDEELTGDEDERALTLARAALRKYADAPDRATFQRRLGGYLQRRGFDAGSTMKIVNRLWQELKHDVEEEDFTAEIAEDAEVEDM